MAEVCMALTLDIPEDLQARLQAEASRLGESVDGLAARLLDRQLPPADRRTAAVALLHGWAVQTASLSDAEAEENATLLRTLDADRPADRPLFTGLNEKAG